MRMMRDHLLEIEGARETVRVDGEGKESEGYEEGGKGVIVMDDEGGQDHQIKKLKNGRVC